MDTNDDLKQEEKVETPVDGADVSLDDMMAAAVPADDAPSQDGLAQAVEVSEDTKTEDEAIEVTVLDPEAEAITPTEEVATPDVTEETPSAEEASETDEASEPEETSSDMIEEANEEAKEDEVEVKEESIEQIPASTPLPARKDYKGKWYIVHTYSGHENKVARTLMQRVQAMGFEERIYDALVPTRDTIRVRGGKKETIKEKIFPGYILVNMDLSDEAWVLVRTTPGVTSFVGAQNKPTPIRDDEVQAIVAFVGQKDPVYKAQFSVGEAVKITDGPFSDFLGTVESIDEAKGKIKVLVSIFGRETPVELDFLQVAKI